MTSRTLRARRRGVKGRDVRCADELEVFESGLRDRPAEGLPAPFSIGPSAGLSKERPHHQEPNASTERRTARTAA